MNVPEYSPVPYCKRRGRGKFWVIFTTNSTLLGSTFVTKYLK